MLHALRSSYLYLSLCSSTLLHIQDLCTTGILQGLSKHLKANCSLASLFSNHGATCSSSGHSSRPERGRGSPRGAGTAWQSHHKVKGKRKQELNQRPHDALNMLEAWGGRCNRGGSRSRFLVGKCGHRCGEILCLKRALAEVPEIRVCLCNTILCNFDGKRLWNFEVLQNHKAGETRGEHVKMFNRVSKKV